MVTLQDGALMRFSDGMAVIVGQVYHAADRAVIGDGGVLEVLGDGIGRRRFRLGNTETFPHEPRFRLRNAGRRGDLGVGRTVHRHLDDARGGADAGGRGQF
jgi:hypothetical protein